MMRPAGPVSDTSSWQVQVQTWPGTADAILCGCQLGICIFVPRCHVSEFSECAIFVPPAVFEGEGESRTSKTVWDHHERQVRQQSACAHAEDERGPTHGCLPALDCEVTLVLPCCPYIPLPTSRRSTRCSSRRSRWRPSTTCCLRECGSTLFPTRSPPPCPAW